MYKSAIKYIEQHLVLSLIVFVTVAAVFIVGTHAALSRQTFDGQAIKEQMETLDSLANEAAFTIDQFTQDKISENYFVGHTQHLNDQVLSFYEQVGSNHIPDDQRSRIEDLEKLVFKLSMSLKAMEDHPSDTAVLRDQQQAIRDIEIQFKNQLKNLTGDSQ